MGVGGERVRKEGRKEGRRVGKRENSSSATFRHDEGEGDRKGEENSTSKHSNCCQPFCLPAPSHPYTLAPSRKRLATKNGTHSADTHPVSTLETSAAANCISHSIAESNCVNLLFPFHFRGQIFLRSNYSFWNRIQLCFGIENVRFVWRNCNRKEKFMGRGARANSGRFFTVPFKPFFLTRDFTEPNQILQNF